MISIDTEKHPKINGEIKKYHKLHFRYKFAIRELRRIDCPQRPIGINEHGATRTPLWRGCPTCPQVPRVLRNILNGRNTLQK